MGRIVSKLDLNKTPQLVDNNSLVFAKNIRVLNDGIIGPDFPIDNICDVPGIIIGYIVGLNSIVYLFVLESEYKIILFEDNLNFPIDGVNAIQNYTIEIIDSENRREVYTKDFSKIIDLEELQNEIKLFAKISLNDFFGIKEDDVLFYGNAYTTIYPHNAEINISFDYTPADGDYIPPRPFNEKTFIYESNVDYTRSSIYSFNEVTQDLTKIDTAWKYSGGKITGVCTTNNTNEVILTIGEYFDYTEDKNFKQIPLKHINLSHCSSSDDESIYTQTPAIPVTNLYLFDTYTKTIPNGVYQFFVRYKIHNNFYTNWFPCSKECFAGSPKLINSVQGSVKYIDTSTDSPKSFILKVEHLFNGINNNEDYTKNYKDFQLGFILSHDDSVVARSWKSFSFDTDTIYFDYEKDFITEINIDDLLKTTYELYNVKNVSYFRDKLYIANYIESNLNPQLQEYAKNIKCELNQISVYEKDDTTFNGFLFKNKHESRNIYSSIGDYSIYEILKNKEYLSQSIEDNLIPHSGHLLDIHSSCYTNAEPYLFLIHGLIEQGFHNTIKNFNQLEQYDYWINSYVVVPENNNDFDNSNHRHYRELINNGRYVIIHNVKGGNLYKAGDAHWITYTGVTANSWRPSAYKFKSNNGSVFSEKENLDYIWFSGGTDPKSENINNPTTNYNDYIGSYNKVSKSDADAGYFKMHSHGFNNYTVIPDYFAEQCLNIVKANYPKWCVYRISFYSENVERVIYEADRSNKYKTIKYGGESYNIEAKLCNDFRGICGTTEYLDLNDIFVKYVANSIQYVDKEGNFYINHKSVLYKVDSYKIEYSTYDYSIYHTERQRTDTGGNNPKYDCEDVIQSVSYDHTYINTITLNKDKLSSSNDITDLKQYRTLLPFTEYKFYIHYFKEDGIPTNGYEICSISKDEFDESKPISVIYPSFKNVIVPEGYKGYFISIYKFGNDIANGFNITTYNNSKIADCLEFDSLLYGVENNIKILNSQGEQYKVGDKNVLGTYYPSSTTEPIEWFGNAGHVAFEKDTQIGDNSKIWFVVTNKQGETDYVNETLIKLTPYISANISEYDNYNDLNCPGYLSPVCKPTDVPLGADGNLYINGTDAYSIKFSSNQLRLEDHGENLNIIDTYKTDTNYVYSNFNLHYLSLFNNDISAKFRSYELKNTTGEVISKGKQVVYLFDSSTISYIYQLPNMYKDYTRKLYRPIQPNNIYIFDNTIRSSNVNANEAYNYIYTFDALDYYAVPANRGKITNVFNISKSLYIHCEHSLFKFVGNNSLATNDSEVKLSETDIFDTGIEEIFDAQHGYGGLQNKKQSIVTYNAYVFYDSISNIIYGYFGDSNLVNISNPIVKLIENKDINDILFVADENNNRFYTNIIYEDNSNICLSFNFNVKNFVSIHDFSFNDGFSTRSNCYFLTETNTKIYRVNTIDKITSYSDLYVLSKLFIKDMKDPIDNVVENCIDIVFNEEYEKIKVLNYINWICSSINKYIDDSNIFMSEEDISKYSGTRIRIYSDECSTELIELETEDGKPFIQNTQTLSDANSYKYPRYNCGIWSLNYFRDIRNTDDIFNYGNIKNNSLGVDNSLIYGKYFVVRVIFRNKNFKFENIKFNIQNYEKV